jgi:DNA polymerase I-like protein with 3'-5' exonuclease and polymerase domains
MKHLFNLSVPVIPIGQISNINQNQISSEKYQQQQRLQYSIQSQKSCCFRAIAVIRSMAKLPPLLRNHRALDLFYNIEMPLLISVADAEYTGFYYYLVYVLLYVLCFS